MSSTGALVVLPTYNERETLEGVVQGVRDLGHAVLVVDDASPDGTGELADRLAAGDGSIAVLHRPSKLGLGSAYKAGFKWGLQHGHQLLVEMDADGSHLPEYLEPLVEAAATAGGLAVGTRWMPGGSVVGWGPWRFALSHGANAYCRAILWLPVRDATSGFRCYTREVLEKIGLDSVVSQGYSFQIEMVYRTLKLGFPVSEVPIKFVDRTLGRSKVSQGEISRALLTVLRLRFTS